MEGFWAGPWLHCPPEKEFAGGRRAVRRQLCFGPAASQVWYVTGDGGCCYEEQDPEGGQEAVKAVLTKGDLLRALEEELDLCRRFHGEALLPLFQAERDALERKDGKELE